MKRLKVLISAYACEPEKGSEPGVGWNVVQEMAKYHQIWVITRKNNREGIEASLLFNSNSNLHFIYFDLPVWARWWKRGMRGVQLYYYLWQIGAYFIAKRLHRKTGFDLAHHVTFGKYWSPSFISLLPMPFIWGPVGGGESAPQSFFTSLGVRGMVIEIVRESARFLAEFDPFIRLTASRSWVAVVKTPETGFRVNRLGAKRVEILGESAISPQELRWFSQFRSETLKAESIRFISIGNLLPLKGFSLGIKAFAKAIRGFALDQLENSEYWVVGDGPELQKLRKLTQRLGIISKVKFWGKLTRKDTLQKLWECQILVHPTLHDSGGWVCLEAMATGKPVICLDLGGPATQVRKETGFKISAHTPNQVVRDMASVMIQLTKDEKLREDMGKAGRKLIFQEYTWEHKGEIFNRYYQEIVQRKNGTFHTEVVIRDPWSKSKVLIDLGDDNHQQTKDKMS